MIHGSLAPVESVSWQSLLSRSITDPEQLLRRLELDPALLAGARAGAADFPLRVPEPFVERMHKSDPNDPLLRQVLPLGEELLEHPDYVLDPLGEQHTNTRAGIIHKYHGRLLLIVSGGCAVNCRYCFRRHFPYGDNNLSTEQWQQALDYIRGDQSISEVIYSGGDPLAASDKRLAWLTREIAAIPHARRLRVHTRLPVVIPQRVTSELIDALCGTRLPVVMVLHSNHANEFDAALGNAVLRLRQAGITLLNQTVLLRCERQPGNPDLAERNPRRSWHFALLSACSRSCERCTAFSCRRRSGHGIGRRDARQTAGLPGTTSGARGGRRNQQDAAAVPDRRYSPLSLSADVLLV